MKGRRTFIKAAAASVMGYTLVYKANNLCAKDLPTCSISTKLDSMVKDAKNMADEATMVKIELDCDVLVAGGGLAGICAAVSAAREGKKVILVQDRSRLGGNASSEIMMHPLGVNSSRTGWREGGIMDELRLENALRNPQLSWQVWDLILYDKCVSEKNLELLLDTSVYSAELDGDKIKSVLARSDAKRSIYKINAKMFIDSTGDSRLAMQAGCQVMSGRDGVKAYNESLAGFDKVGTRQGSSIMFTSRKHDKPMRFIAPSWAKKITEKDLVMKRVVRPEDILYGCWFIELGGENDAIVDTEMLRFELLAIVMGIWDYIKNSGKFKDVENIAIDSLGMYPGRRDTYRIVGEHVFTQHDIEGKWKDFDDSVAVGGWSMDDHPAGGFYASDKPACVQMAHVACYNIPLSSLYSKDIKNLLMAGRNVSCSHVAFTSTRVMATCAVMGQAVGTCAAMCIDDETTPSKLRATPKLLRKLQQKLLAQDQTILGVKNEDDFDLLRGAKVSATSSDNATKVGNLQTGLTIDAPKKNDNKWQARVSSKPEIRFDWSIPRYISKVQLVFDAGTEWITQTGRTWIMDKMILDAQPTLVKDYTLCGIDEHGNEVILQEVKNNYQRLNTLNFDSKRLKALIVKIHSTNGAELAGVFEVRAYA